MAAKRKAKAGKGKARAVKKKAKATRKPAKKAVGKKAPARKAAPKKTVKAGASRGGTAKNRKKAPARKKQQIVGEGDYAASRSFLKDQAGFVKRNKAKIPAMGKEAERALDGAEGEALRAAEEKAKARSRAPEGERDTTEPGEFVIPPG